MLRGRHRVPVLVLIVFATIVILFLVAASRATNESASGAPFPDAGASSSASPPRVARCSSARRGLAFYRDAIDRHRFRLDARRSVSRAPAHRLDCRAARAQSKIARDRARRLRRAYESWLARTYEKWRCVHEHEGAWNDPHPTYYGGLQMDSSFMRSYGGEYLERWGTADRWPVWAQLRAAERAHRVRGFDPWPTYRRFCS
jgi:Transglycosylase-like domain